MASSQLRAEQDQWSRRLIGLAFEWACRLSAWASFVVLAVLVGSIGVSACQSLSWRFVTSHFSTIHPERAGCIAGLVGSLWLIVLTGLFAVPIGVGTAVYLEECAKKNWLTTTIQINIANLAGVPSVVYGMLGFAAFVRMFGMQKGVYQVSLGFMAIDLPFGKKLISGALTLALLSLPVIIIATQEALRAVPPSIRHASFALGATRWQTIWRQTLPAAMPGIVTGVILSLSRAIGETAPLATLGIAVYLTSLPGGIGSFSDVVHSPSGLLRAPFDSFVALPLQIYYWVSASDPVSRSLASAGIVVLLGLLLSLNLTAMVIRNRSQKHLKW